jgi:hypothetical protein
MRNSKKLLVCETCGKHVPIGGNLEGIEYCTVHFNPQLQRCDGGGLPGLEVASGGQFVCVRTAVMLGPQWIATACSKTMAKRIANALNRHTPNREGV